MNVKKVLSELDKRKKSIAVQRDKLRDLGYEIANMEDNCSDAIENIERAIDAMSEMV